LSHSALTRARESIACVSTGLCFGGEDAPHRRSGVTRPVRRHKGRTGLTSPRALRILSADSLMRKLVQVEDAKSLLEVAKEWGVWKWLMEKKRVRRTADIAWEAFDELEKDVRSAWSDDLNKAYAELAAEAEVKEGGAPAKRKYEKARKEAADVDPKIKALAQKQKEIDDEAWRVRMQAEDMFDEAEKRLSTSMAREASQVAIDAYNLREKAVRKAESAARAKVG